MTDLDRSGTERRWDPRLRPDQQTGEKVYAGNDIVRRTQAVWGDTRAEAARANEDTFHYASAAPQAAKFNQGMDLWLGLESYLQDNAAATAGGSSFSPARSSVTPTPSTGTCRFR